MKLRTVLANRFFALVTGFALLGIGAFALAWLWEVPLARDRLSQLDRPRVIDVPDLDAALAMAKSWPMLELEGTSVEIRPMVTDYSQFEQ